MRLAAITNMVVGEKKLDKEKGDHKVTFTLTVALAFPSGMCCIKILIFEILNFRDIKLHRFITKM